MTVIPDLEKKLVAAAHREMTAVSTRPGRRARLRRLSRDLARASVLVVAVAVAAIVGVGAVVVLGGHEASTVPGTSTTARDRLIASLAVLRRPQTAADRAFDQTGWPTPPASPGSQTRPDRRLIRLATITPWGAKVFVVPLTISGPHPGEAVALWVQGIGWSDYARLADINSGLAFGPLRSIHKPGGGLESRFFEIVPDGVAKVVFYNQAGSERQRPSATITAIVHNNIAVFQDTGGARLALAKWYSADGRLVKRVGDWNLKAPSLGPRSVPADLKQAFAVFGQPRRAADAIPSGYLQGAVRNGAAPSGSRLLLTTPPSQGAKPNKIWLIPASGSRLCVLDEQGLGGGLECIADSVAVQHGVIRGIIGRRTAMMFGGLPRGTRNAKIVQANGVSHPIRPGFSGAFAVVTNLPAALSYIQPNGQQASESLQPAGQPPRHGRSGNVPRCQTAQLKIGLRHSYAAAGTAGAYITFTNDSRQPCQLDGWPRLIGVTAGGEVARARHLPAGSFTGPTVAFPRAPRVILHASQRADAVFAGTDVPPNTRTCNPPLKWLHIAPPDNPQTVRVSAWIGWLGADMPWCARIAVSPVLPATDMYHG